MLAVTIRTATSGEPGQPMAQQFALTDDTPTYNPRYADAFVVFAVTVLSLAIGVWCLLRLGFTLWMGTAAALAAYAVLLAVHLAVRRSLVAADDGVPDHDSGDIWMQSPYAPSEPASHVRDSQGSDAPSSPDEEIVRWTQAARAGDKGMAEELPPPRPAEPFDFRPKQDPSLPLTPPGGLASLSARNPKVQEPRPDGTPQPAMSVEFVQDLIKKLADELNSTTAAAQAGKPIPASATEAMIGHSVAALQATARTVPGPQAHSRAAPGQAPQTPSAAGAPSWWPTMAPASGPDAKPEARPPSAPPPVNPQLARIAEAV